MKENPNYLKAYSELTMPQKTPNQAISFFFPFFKIFVVFLGGLLGTWATNCLNMREMGKEKKQHINFEINFLPT